MRNNESTEYDDSVPYERIAVTTVLNGQTGVVNIGVTGDGWSAEMSAMAAQINAEHMLEAIDARTDNGQDAGYNCHFGERTIPMTRTAFIDFAALLLRSSVSAQAENHLSAFIQEQKKLSRSEARAFVLSYREFAARWSEDAYNRNADE